MLIRTCGRLGPLCGRTSGGIVQKRRWKNVGVRRNCSESQQSHRKLARIGPVTVDEEVVELRGLPALHAEISCLQAVVAALEAQLATLQQDKTPPGLKPNKP